MPVRVRRKAVEQFVGTAPRHGAQRRLELGIALFDQPLPLQLLPLLLRGGLIGQAARTLARNQATQGQQGRSQRTDGPGEVAG